MKPSRLLRTMPKHRGIVVAGLAVVLLALSPASALAKAGGTDRPVKGTATGNVTVTLAVPLGITIDLTGVATHFGKYSAHIDADGDIIGGGVVGDGTFTLVAANGDQVTGPVQFTGTLPTSDFHTTTAVLTITGGTGRFADASGTITSQNLVTPTCFAEPSCPGLITETLKGKQTGQISY